MILPGQISSHKTKNREPDKVLVEKGTGHKGCLANKRTLGYPSSMVIPSENEQDENQRLKLVW
jgi:hypothetical protein